MIPMRLIFRSRWAALAWAAGICITAVQFAGGDGGQDTGNSVGANSETAALLSDLQ